MRRLATKIAGQELYYPRSHQSSYPAFKRGYMETVEVIIRSHAHGDGTETIDEGNVPESLSVTGLVSSLSDTIRRAAGAFFEEFEDIDERKLARKRVRGLLRPASGRT